MFKYNERQIKPGKSWIDDNGIKHPSNWNIWSSEEKAAYNIVELIPESPPDSKFYKWNMDSDLKVHSTEKNLEDEVQVDGDGEALLDLRGNQVLTLGLKSTFKNQVKETQKSLLDQTDWALARKVDTDRAVPDDIQTWRDAIRSKATEMEDAIDDCSSIDQIQAIFLSWDEDGNKSGILYDWPELDD